MTVNKEKLDKKEFKILKKIADKLMTDKFDGQTENARKESINFLSSQLDKKIEYNIGEQQFLGNRYVVCYLNIGKQNKTCYLLFDKLKNVPPLLIPSGVFELNDSISM